MTIADKWGGVSTAFWDALKAWKDVCVEITKAEKPDAETDPLTQTEDSTWL